MDELSRVWLACAIDGEGHIGFRKHSSRNAFRVSIILGNTNLKFLEKAQQICGTGNIHLQRSKSGKSFPLYCWYISKASECERILREILPYLIIKKARAEQALLFLKYRRQKGRYTRHGIVEKTFSDGKESEIKDILELL